MVSLSEHLNSLGLGQSFQCPTGGGGRGGFGHTTARNIFETSSI